MTKKKVQWKPFVSVCTPTFNRRPFIPFMLDCFRHQTYPLERVEWIIVDDGTDPIEDLLYAAKDLKTNIQYFRLEKKMPLGEKRNFMHTKAKGSILVYMDDDDYYPPERIAHAVETLQANKEALCAGSSELYIYFKHIGQMYQAGPYGPNHATAGTFAFKSRMLDETKYDNHAALAEEKAFLKDYTIPFVQLDPLKTILVFSHDHNTFDKRKLLLNPNPQVFKPSTKGVDDFIHLPAHEHIRRFFMEEIDALLATYAPGFPDMKPDVLQQTKELEIKREALLRQKQMQHQQMPFINVTTPSGETVALNAYQVVELLQSLQKQNEQLKQMLFAKTDSSGTMMVNI